MTTAANQHTFGIVRWKSKAIRNFAFDRRTSNMWLHHHYAQFIVKNFVQNQVEARNQAATIQLIREVSDLIVQSCFRGLFKPGFELHRDCHCNVKGNCCFMLWQRAAKWRWGLASSLWQRQNHLSFTGNSCRSNDGYGVSVSSATYLYKNAFSLLQEIFACRFLSLYIYTFLLSGHFFFSNTFYGPPSWISKPKADYNWLKIRNLTRYPPGTLSTLSSLSLLISLA